MSRFFVLFFLIIFLCGSVLAEAEFREAALGDVLNLLAQRSGYDLIAPLEVKETLQKRISLKINDAEYLAILKQLLLSHNLAYEFSGQQLVLSSFPSDISGSAFEKKSEVVDLDYILASEALETLTKLLPGLLAVHGSGGAQICLRGTSRQIAEAKKILSGIDQAPKQILIEAQVMEVSSSDLRQLGLDYKNSLGDFNFSFKDSGFTMDGNLLINLKKLVSEGKARILASPSILAQAHKEAVVNIGSRLPYAVPASSGNSNLWNVSYIEAGINLKITPRIGEKNLICAKIKPEVSAISEWRPTIVGEFPVIASRNVETEVAVEDGQTIVVGGLKSEMERETTVRVPWFSHLPILGNLFQWKNREKEKTEIIFLITPHLAQYKGPQ